MKKTEKSEECRKVNIKRRKTKRSENGEREVQREEK
jgi:hypothetical protein